jgi:hypothetical protein
MRAKMKMAMKFIAKKIAVVVAEVVKKREMFLWVITTGKCLILCWNLQKTKKQK